MSESTPTSKAKGSCLCSSVTYEITGDPMFSVVCHCLNCQKFGGSAMAANLIFSPEQFKLSDPQSLIKSFEDPNTDSGNPNEKYFCSKCGSGIVIKPKHAEGRPDMAIVLSGTLDNIDEMEKSGWAPKTEIYCMAGKRSWFPDLKDGKKFDRMVTRS